MHLLFNDDTHLDGTVGSPKLLDSEIISDFGLFRSSGPVRNLSAAKLGLPQVAPAESNGSGVGRRRMFDGFLDH